jgi:hypothetical protein
LKSDSESVLDLLADPFLPSPEKNNAYAELKDGEHQGHLLKHDNLHSYANESPLPADQVEEVDEPASKIITLVKQSEVPKQQPCNANESPLPADKLEEVDEPARKIITLVKQLEVPKQQPCNANESPVPADQLEEVDELASKIITLVKQSEVPKQQPCNANESTLLANQLEEVEEPGSEITTVVKQSEVLKQQPCIGNENTLPANQLEEVEELASKLEHELYKPPTNMFPELVFVTDGEYNQPNFKELEQAADGLGKPALILILQQ